MTQEQHQQYLAVLGDLARSLASLKELHVADDLHETVTLLLRVIRKQLEVSV